MALGVFLLLSFVACCGAMAYFALKLLAELFPLHQPDD